MDQFRITRIVAWLLIVIGLGVLIALCLYYYDTPFGYGNHDGMMVALFVPAGVVPLLSGLALLAFIHLRKH